VAGVACRFDDVEAGIAWCLSEPVGQLVATQVEHVEGVLRHADAAVAAGRYVAGFVTYEAAPAFDAALAVRAPAPSIPSPPGSGAPAPAGPTAGGAPEPTELPLAWFGVFRRRVPVRPVVASDRDRGGGWPLPGHGASATGGRRTRGAGPGAGDRGGSGAARWCSDMSAADHRRAVADVRQRIARGEVYQVNVTARLRRTWAPSPSATSALYRRLARAQQASGHALLALPGWTVVAASPEEWFHLDGQTLRCRPMKGTASRGSPPLGPDDQAAAERLVGSAKERAENVMIVDLVRNDLGRVAQIGTVAVPSLCQLEAYPTVWQLTSTVTAQLRPDTGLTEVFQALFPSGSVTGAPKVAAMAAIAALERSPRGVYCGAVGWAGPGPRGMAARFWVPIRTVVIDHDRGLAEYGVGSGITWSSEPSAEWRELVAKSRVLDVAGAGSIAGTHGGDAGPAGGHR